MIVGHRLLTLAVATTLAAGALTACTPADSGASGDSTPPGPSTSTAPTPTTDPISSPPPDELRPVEHPTLWLCRPMLADNPCEGGLDSTAITAGDVRTEVPFTPAADPVADCFYVYPTVSEASTRNAPLKVSDAERFVVRAQAARFAASCRVFAPVYRQITRAGLTSGGLTDPKARALAFSDVRSAFNDYLNIANLGRPFVLIGHSQGAWMVEQLIQTQIDGNPTLRARMLSALVFGGTVSTPPGQATGGSFVNVATCGSADQSGCVAGYSTYSGTPPADGLFARSSDTRTALCVSPAALLGRGDALSPELPTAALSGGTPRVKDAPTTGFVTFPGGVTGQCRSTAGFHWLDVRISEEITDALPDLATGSGARWGLHRGDMSLALDDLVDLVSAQSAAWTARGGPSTG